MAYANAYKRGREEGRAATGRFRESVGLSTSRAGHLCALWPEIESMDRVWNSQGNSSKPALPRYIFSQYRSEN